MSKEQDIADKLRREAYAVGERFSTINHRCQNLVHTRTQAQRKAIEACLAAEHGDELRVLQSEWRDRTRKAEDAEIEAGKVALAAMGDPRRVEWQRRDSYSKLEKTGRTAKYEVYTRETALSEAKTSKPGPGEIFLRINKKDGTPGLLFERPHSEDDPWGWHPVDWSPEQ